MLDIIEKGMLAVDVRTRWKMDQVYTGIIEAVKDLPPE